MPYLLQIDEEYEKRSKILRITNPTNKPIVNYRVSNWNELS